MPEAHKFANSRIEASTSVHADQLTIDAFQVAEQTRGPGLNKHLPLGVAVIDQSVTETTSLLQCAVTSKDRGLLGFNINIEQSGDRATLTTKITKYATRQAKVAFGLVGVGPTEMVGYMIYKQYMLDLRARLLEKDPRAHVQIVEQA